MSAVVEEHQKGPRSELSEVVAQPGQAELNLSEDVERDEDEDERESGLVLATWISERSGQVVSVPPDWNMYWGEGVQIVPVLPTPC